ncbi:integrase [Tanacetum coccineum]
MPKHRPRTPSTGLDDIDENDIDGPANKHDMDESEVIERSCDKPMIVLEHNEINKELSAEEISSKILKNLKETAEAYLGTKDTDAMITTGLVAGIDHGKARRGLAEVAAYDPSVEERYVSVVLPLCDLDFNFLSQLESHKDASIASIMESLHFDGPSAETPEVSRLQPAYEQLLLPIYQKEDNAVIGETSLSDSLNVVHDCVQKVKEVGEASTSRVPATAATTIALSASITTANVSSVPPILVADYEVLNAKPQPKASHSPKIIFEEETLETSPEHPMTS